MKFTSVLYGLFLVIVLITYWNIKQSKFRLWTIIISSIVFYASWDVQYIPLMVVLTFINFRLGLEIAENSASNNYSKKNNNNQNSDQDIKNIEADWNPNRLKILALGICLNVGLLLVFKYSTILSQWILRWDITLENASFKLGIPLGISFFTFENIAYLIDVYRGVPPADNLLKFASYKLFFPKLISGPITRYHQTSWQFDQTKINHIHMRTEGLWLIARGAVKKGVLADNLGIFVELCFNNIQRAGSTDLWLATFAYGFQLYLDFNGYVDIARGSALLLGLVLPENFDFPYLSSSIADFWRRWHITLGDWLRNYLYFPLGGSRRGLLRTCVNLLIVMLIAGIWHGSAWGFLVWGGSHGIALCIHRVTDVVSNNFKILRLFWHHPLGIILAWLLTQLTVFISWIWFRLPRIEDSALVMGNLWGHTADVQFIEKVYMEALNTSPNQVLWGLILIFVFMIVAYVFKRKLHLELRWQLKLVFVPLCFYAVWLLAPQGSLPYIYFDF